MATVHVYSSLGRFRSYDELRAYIDPKYADDGDRTDSDFMREVQLARLEPMCIEAVQSEAPSALSALLDGVSYSEQWLRHLDGAKMADAAICVFEPNAIQCPGGSS